MGRRHLLKQELEEQTFPQTGEERLLSLQWEEHRTGSATPAVQWGSVPRRLFFAAQQRIAITLKPNQYQKNRCSKRRRNQQEEQREVM